MEPGDRERRRRIISDLARLREPQAPSTRTTGTAPPAPVAVVSSERRIASRKSNRGRWWLAVAVTLAIVLIAALVLPRLLAPAPRHTSPAISIDPGTARLGCADDAAWSPTGDFIAVLGYQSICPNTDSTQMYESGQVTIYSAKTGKWVTSLILDPLILHTHKITLGQPSTIDGNLFAPFIGYEAVLWSPDGSQLALPFVVLQQPYAFPVPNYPPQAETGSPPTQAGVLLTNLSGTAVSVLVAHYALPQTGPVLPMEWNVRAGTLVSSSLHLSPSLSYAWGDDGALLPRQALNSSSASPAAAPPGPVGNPSGGQTFTIWQPGQANQGSYLTPVSGNGTGQTDTATFVPGLNLWYSDFAVWSPDGRYLVTPGYYGGRMAIRGQPIPSSHDLQLTGQTGTPVFAPHDQAMQTYYESTRFAFVAWSPDGKILATLQYHSTSNETSTTVLVTLWGSASGKQLRSFTLKSTSVFTPGSDLSGLVGSAALEAFLRWSPDGSHLLFLDADLDGKVTIWSTR